MVSNFAVIFLSATSLSLLAFMIYSTRKGGEQLLIHKLYFMLSFVMLAWSIAVLGIKFTDPGNATALYIWDALTYVGVAYGPVIILLIPMTMVSGKEEMPKSWWLLFIVPTITFLMVWTNPLHHLYYRVFSVVRSELVFSPYILVSGGYSYLCMMAGIVLLVRFARKNLSRLYMTQCILVALGILTPLCVSILATSGIVNLSIAATPISYVFTILFNGVAIYRLHLLDIKPLATQHVLDWISDCYLVLSDTGLVVSHNQPFYNVFGVQYGITENCFLQDCVKEEDVAGKTAIYNLMTAVDTCRQSRSTISYEQAVSLPTPGGGAQKLYYIADITPLMLSNKISGFVVIFKDITQVKKSMQQLQDSQARMMEQERLAFLGQMVGGLAHNLKTPIMSISGCTSAVENLVEEARDSLADPEVTPQDYREIYREIDDWLIKIRDACSYMSDIITAIKGQAANVTTSETMAFTLDELVKRSTLLMRHELQSSGCQLTQEYDPNQEIVLHGDINNLIQVLNNLITNAIDAERPGGGKIYIGVSRDDTHLNIYVKDQGSGVDPRVKNRLFKEMITSKGTKGTGLGLYISNAVVRGKFGGFMWVKDNPSGGAIFGFSIPLEHVSIVKVSPRKEGQA